MAVGLLFLFALGGLPRLALGPRIRAVGLGLALLQAALGWALLPSPEPPPDALERAIGQALAQAPPRSILADDRESYRLLAWAGTARPFLLPRTPALPWPSLPQAFTWTASSSARAQAPCTAATARTTLRAFARSGGTRGAGSWSGALLGTRVRP